MVWHDWFFQLATLWKNRLIDFQIRTQSVAEKITFQGDRTAIWIGRHRALRIYHSDANALCMTV